MSRHNKVSPKICSLEFGKTSQKNFSGYQQDLNPGGFGEKAASIPTTPRYPFLMRRPREAHIEEPPNESGHR